MRQVNVACQVLVNCVNTASFRRAAIYQLGSDIIKQYLHYRFATQSKQTQSSQ